MPTPEKKTLIEQIQKNWLAIGIIATLAVTGWNFRGLFDANAASYYPKAAGEKTAEDVSELKTEARLIKQAQENMHHEIFEVREDYRMVQAGRELAPITYHPLVTHTKDTP